MVRILPLLCASLLLLSACDSQPSRTIDDDLPEVSAAQEVLKRVTDAAGIIDDAQEARLTRQLQDLERRTGRQMVVVTVASLNGRTIEEYTLDLARRWGVGRRDHDDGLVVLVAPTERKVRIEVGTGLGAVVTDRFAEVVIETDMLPRFAKDNYGAGLDAGIAALIDRVSAR